MALKNVKMTDAGSNKATSNTKLTQSVAEAQRVNAALQAAQAQSAQAQANKANATLGSVGKTGNLVGAQAGANALKGAQFTQNLIKNQIKQTMGYANTPEELWQSYNEYNKTYDDGSNKDNGGGGNLGDGGNTNGGGGATRAISGGGSGSSGGGGGVSTESLIGNLVTDPTAEVRQRYAGILADLANNNQYVLDKLKGNYDTSVNTINADYDTSISRQNADAEDALRQAYINYMMSRKNMDSALARQGYTGGLSESNQARMFNNYGNIRNDIRKTLNNAIENYNLKRNAALGEALNQYNAQLADQASDYFNKKQNYETALSNAIANLMR